MKNENKAVRAAIAVVAVTLALASCAYPLWAEIGAWRVGQVSASR